MRTLVRGGTVVSATHASVADVLVDGEEIVAVGDVGEVDANVVGGLYAATPLNWGKISRPYVSSVASCPCVIR